MDPRANGIGRPLAEGDQGDSEMPGSRRHSKPEDVPWSCSSQTRAPARPRWKHPRLWRRREIQPQLSIAGNANLEYGAAYQNRLEQRANQILDTPDISAGRGSGDSWFPFVSWMLFRAGYLCTIVQWSVPAACEYGSSALPSWVSGSLSVISSSVIVSKTLFTSALACRETVSPICCVFIEWCVLEGGISASSGCEWLPARFPSLQIRGVVFRGFVLMGVVSTLRMLLWICWDSGISSSNWSLLVVEGGGELCHVE